MNELHDAVAVGDDAAVERCLALGDNVAGADARGLTPLHIAAAAGHPVAWRIVIGAFDIGLLAVIGDLDDAAHVGIAERLIRAGAPLDARAGIAELTPLMIARYVGASRVADLLIARGANIGLRDAWGRTSERLTTHRTCARLLRVCSRLPTVAAMHVGQILGIAAQLTSPLVGITLTGPLPPGAFAGWPPDDVIAPFKMSDDPVSQLLRLTPALYERPDPTPVHDVAVALAAALGGEVRVIPSDGGRAGYAVVVHGGGVPLRVFAVPDEDRTTVELVTNEVWHVRDATAEAELAPIVAATRVWESTHGNVVTPLELAIDAVATLSVIAETPFEVVEVHSTSQAAIAARERPHAKLMIGKTTRDKLHRARWALVAEYRAQRIASTRVHAVMDALPADVVPPHGAWRVMDYVAFTDLVWVDAVGRMHTAIRAELARGVVRAHVGLIGKLAKLGWDGDLSDLQTQMAPIIAALRTQVATLTVDRLVPGARYRVRETLDVLEVGMIVAYVGVDDIDNHWGTIDFIGPRDQPLKLSCDPSSLEFSALADAGRYLEPL